MFTLRCTLSAIRFTLVTTLLLGLAYPLVVTGLAQLVFTHQANGSLLTRDGHTVGSTLIGQAFVSPAYLHGRPSAAGAGYDGLASGGSNLGPTSQALTEAVRARVAAAALDRPGAPVPVDLVTASASGLDAHLSPAAALFQAARIARARGVDEDAVRQVITQHIEGRTFGLFGEPRVNVLLVNLALDRQFPLMR